MSEIISITCIACPNSCTLSGLKGSANITGAACKLGIKFYIDETTNPMRTLCTTVKTAFCDSPTLAVRTDGDIPKGLMKDVITALKDVTVNHPVKRGDIIVGNILSTGVNIISSNDME